MSFASLNVFNPHNHIMSLPPDLRCQFISPKGHTKCSCSYFAAPSYTTICSCGHPQWWHGSRPEEIRVETAIPKLSIPDRPLKRKSEENLQQEGKKEDIVDSVGREIARMKLARAQARPDYVMKQPKMRLRKASLYCCSCEGETESSDNSCARCKYSRCV
jgi:hypothetical protein